MGTWDPLIKRLKVYKRNPVPPARPEALDEYEAANGFKLPESYRQFVLALGPGELGERFAIAAPGYPRNKFHVDLTKLNRVVHELETLPEDQLREAVSDPQQFRRLVFFGRTSGADVYGWDPQDVRDPAGPEYGIYEAPRHDPVVVNVAGSFPEFVEKFCLGRGRKKTFEAAGDYPDDGSPPPG